MSKDPVFLYPKNWHCVSDFVHIKPELPGCYAIYIFNIETKKQRLIYIGTAENLYRRLKKHEILKVLNTLIELPELPMIKCKIITNTEKRFYTEKWLIERLKPKANYL